MRICKRYYVRNRQERSLELVIPEERISAALIADSGGRSVSGVDNGFIGQDHKLFMNASDQTFMAHSRKIGPTDT